MTITGYKYETKAQALQVINQLNSHWQLPRPNATSKFTMDLFQTWGGGYWMQEDAEWYEPVLGTPMDFEIPEIN